jgi:hypothetical protein
MFSSRRLMLAFIVFCMAFLVFTFPPSLFFSMAGAGKPVTYRQLTGSVFHTKFEGLAIAGTYLGDGYFEPNLGDVLTGTFGGTVVFSKGLHQGSVIFSMRNEDQMELSHLKATSQTVLKAPFGTLEGGVFLDVSNMALSLSRGCISGQIKVQTSVFDGVLENLGFQAVPFDGVGVCNQNGAIEIKLGSVQKNISFIVDVSLNSRQNWNRPQAQITVLVSSKNADPLPQSLVSQLVGIGMEPKEGGYAIAFTASLDGTRGELL